MAEYSYYCRVSITGDGLTPGVYVYRGEFHDIKYRLFRMSDMIWRQGPRGGVKLIKNREFGSRTYVTKDEKEMKEFMWAKLQAQPFK